MLIESGKKIIEIHAGQWINQFIPAGDTDLDETQLFRIRMEAVCLGIQRDPWRGLYGLA